MAILNRFCITAFVFAAICSRLIPAAGAQESGNAALPLVSFGVGEQHLKKQIDPIYPPLAKAANIQGIVTLLAIVSPTGMVETVHGIQGHPMLMQAGIDAAKQWQYEPFVFDGRPVPTRVAIQILFRLPEPSAAERDWDEYKRQESKCGWHLSEHRYADAEESCKTLADIAGKLPPEHQGVRPQAYAHAGDSFWFQQKFPEAQAYYLKEVESAEKIGDPKFNAGLMLRTQAHAYHDAAHGFQGVGDFNQASLYYRRADQTLEEYYAQTQSALLQIESDKSADPNRYQAVELEVTKKDLVKSWQSVLLEYAAMLRQTGDASAADAAEEKAKSISAEIGSKQR